MIHNLFTRTWFVYSAVGIAMKTQSEFSIKQSNYEKSQFKSSVLFGMKQTHSYKSRSQQCKYKKKKDSKFIRCAEQQQQQQRNITRTRWRKRISNKKFSYDLRDYETNLREFNRVSNLCTPIKHKPICFFLFYKFSSRFVWNLSKRVNSISEYFNAIFATKNTWKCKGCSFSIRKMPAGTIDQKCVKTRRITKSCYEERISKMELAKKNPTLPTEYREIEIERVQSASK